MLRLEFTANLDPRRAREFSRNVSHLEIPVLLVGKGLDGTRVDDAGHVLLRHGDSVFGDDGLARRGVSRDEHTFRTLPNVT